MKFKPLKDRVFVKYSEEGERRRAVFTYRTPRRKNPRRVLLRR